MTCFTHLNSVCACVKLFLLHAHAQNQVTVYLELCVFTLISWQRLQPLWHRPFISVQSCNHPATRLLWQQDREVCVFHVQIYCTAARQHCIVSWQCVLLQLVNCGLSDVTIKALEARGITALFPIQKHVYEPAAAGGLPASHLATPTQLKMLALVASLTAVQLSCSSVSA